MDREAGRALLRLSRTVRACVLTCALLFTIALTFWQPLTAVEFSGWHLPLSEDTWQASADPAAIQGYRWERADPPAYCVLAYRRMATSEQQFDSADAAMEAAIVDVLNQPAVVLTSRRDLVLEKMPAVLLEWKLTLAETEWAQMALVVADREQGGVVVAMVGMAWDLRETQREPTEALLMTLQRQAASDQE